LADSIRSLVDDNTPNGQLNPGRVVRREGGYYVYIGIRRFLALKSLHESTGDQRFGVFSAYVDENLSELQMFIKAKAENEEERGERQRLSILEEVSGMSKIRESMGKLDGLDPSLKRLASLADKFDDERLKKLYDVEKASGSRFTLAQLEGLSRVQGEKEFYTTAASTAGFRVDDVPSAERNRTAAYHLDWFPRLFPDYKKEGELPGSRIPSRVDHPEVKEPLEVHEEGVIVVQCPKCEGGNMLRCEGEITLVHLSPDPEGELEAAVAESVAKATFACSHCGETFNVFVTKLDTGGYAVATSLSDGFVEPKEELGALNLRYNHRKKAWEMIEGDEIVGPLRLSSLAEEK
jgi:transcription elongation factor Elf1